MTCGRACFAPLLSSRAVTFPAGGKPDISAIVLSVCASGAENCAQALKFAFVSQPPARVRVNPPGVSWVVSFHTPQGPLVGRSGCFIWLAAERFILLEVLKKVDTAAVLKYICFAQVLRLADWELSRSDPPVPARFPLAAASPPVLSDRLHLRAGLRLEARRAPRASPQGMVQTSLVALAAAVARAAPRLRKAPIALTDAAAERIRALLDKRNKARCKAEGSSRGCDASSSPLCKLSLGHWMSLSATRLWCCGAVPATLCQCTLQT